jgi:hypothetical protein
MAGQRAQCCLRPNKAHFPFLLSDHKSRLLSTRSSSWTLRRLYPRHLLPTM